MIHEMVICNQEQVAELMKLKNYILKIKFGGGTNYFQRGVLLTIDSILALHSHLKCKHGLPYLMCSHCDQDYCESIIGVMREGGGVRKPNAMALTYRIQRNLLYQFLPHFLTA